MSNSNKPNLKEVLRRGIAKAKGVAPATISDDQLVAFAQAHSRQGTAQIERGDLDPTSREALEGMIGLDLGPAVDEWQRDGKLSDDTYAMLARAGYGRSVVDNFTAGLQDVTGEASATPAAAADSIEGQEAASGSMPKGKLEGEAQFPGTVAPHLPPSERTSGQIASAQVHMKESADRAGSQPSHLNVTTKPSRVDVLLPMPDSGNAPSERK